MQTAVPEGSLHTVALIVNTAQAGELPVLVVASQLSNSCGRGGQEKSSIPGSIPPIPQQLPAILEPDDGLSIPPAAGVRPPLVLVLPPLPALPAEGAVGVQSDRQPVVDGGLLLSLRAREVRPSDSWQPLSHTEEHLGLACVNNARLSLRNLVIINLNILGVWVRGQWHPRAWGGYRGGRWGGEGWREQWRLPSERVIPLTQAIGSWTVRLWPRHVPSKLWPGPRHVFSKLRLWQAYIWYDADCPQLGHIQRGREMFRIEYADFYITQDRTLFSPTPYTLLPYVISWIISHIVFI